MIRLYNIDHFNLEETFLCGQCFRWEKDENGVFYGVVANHAAKAYYHDPKTIYIESSNPDLVYWSNYLNFSCDYNKVEKKLSEEEILRPCIEAGRGIRILRQDLWETIVSFIISANNNIKRIQLIVERLCQALGEKTEHGYAFPTVERMAEQSVEFYSRLGAGYRDKYLLTTAQKLLTYNLDALVEMDTATARKELLTFMGVGPKVADCILLFGMRHGDVFPVDTWLKKVYHQYFEQGHADHQLSAYFCNLFGEDAGLCQQYLFYFQRKV